MDRPPLHVRLWSHLPPRLHLWVASHIVAVIVGGLLLDIGFGWPGQHLATVWTLAVFAWLFHLGRGEERRVLMLCMLIAGAGEVVLSLVWGLYDYQFANVPLFVPPGHALLMTLGLVVARHLTRSAVVVVLVGGMAWSLYAGTLGFDQLGVALFGLFVMCLAIGSAKTLYAAMFVLALCMELYGTALGNWQWQASVPLTPLSSANPPFSAGAFYCVLDFLVLGALALRERQHAPGL